MRGTWSLAVIAIVVSLAACQDRASPPGAGMGAGAAPLDTLSRAPAPSQLDSAPWEADSAAIPSSLTPVRADSVAAADSAKADSAKRKRPSASTSVKPEPALSETAAQPSGDSSSGAATSGAAASQTASTSSGTELRDAYHKAPLDTVDGKTYQGWKYYNLNCARCHGEDVSGTTIAPHLITSLKPEGPAGTKELFIQTVCEGRVPKGMPAWCQTGMTPAEIDTIYSYVKGRSEAKLHPGRPARSGG